MTDSSEFYKTILLFGLILARMVAIINLVPFLGGKNAPHQAKVGMAILFSLIFWPYVYAHSGSEVPHSLIVYIFFLLKEVFVGFVIGFVTAQIFYCVEMMGQIVDVVRGTNQAQLLVPQLQERSSAFGDFNFQLALVLLLSLGFHIPFFEILGESFIRIPVLSFEPSFVDSSHAIEFFTRLLADVFRIACTLAFPIAFVCLLCDVAFGLLNRVAPQINAYFMSMPAKAAGGMVIFLFAFTMIMDQFALHGFKFLDTVREALNVLK